MAEEIVMALKEMYRGSCDEEIIIILERINKVVLKNGLYVKIIL